MRSRYFVTSLIVVAGLLLVVGYQNFTPITVPPDGTSSGSVTGSTSSGPGPLPSPTIPQGPACTPVLTASSTAETVVNFAACKLLGVSTMSNFLKAKDHVASGETTRRGAFGYVVDSSEFANAFSGLGDAEFVNTMSTKLLGTLDANVPRYISELGSKIKTRKQVVLSLVDSTAFRNANLFLESKPNEFYWAVENIIRDLSVVNDAILTKNCGPLTFCFAVTQMAGANDPSTFVEKWLQTWQTSQVVNGFSLGTRSTSSLLSNWPKVGGKLDLTKAPFRLLAVINRNDLREGTTSPTNAGQGRLVFGVLSPSPVGGPESWFDQSFVVIFEYGQLFAPKLNYKKWFKRWHALSTLTLGSEQYNARLAKVTRLFTAKGFKGRPNKSALFQIRTNEIALSSPWELREFNIGTDGFLKNVTVKQTPSFTLNNSSLLTNYISANQAAILAETHVVPEQFSGQNFLGGTAPVMSTFSNQWQAAGMTPAVMQKFSLNTCNGCHGGATQTSFLHVNNRPFERMAELSGFFTGINSVDPVTGAKFHDIRRRADDIRAQLVATESSRAEIGSAQEEESLGVNVRFIPSTNHRVH